MFTLLHIGSRLFEILRKKVGEKKQPGRPLKLNQAKTSKQNHTIILLKQGIC